MKPLAEAAYAQVAALWLQEVKDHGEDAGILLNASAFFQFADQGATRTSC